MSMHRISSQFKLCTLATGALLAITGLHLPANLDKRIEFESDANRMRDLLSDQCISCHREGGAGPFPLDTHQLFKKRAGLVRDILIRREMPPVFATSEVGKFSHMVEMDDENTLLLQRYIQAGMPKWDGEPSMPAVKPAKPSFTLRTLNAGLIAEEGVPYVKRVVLPTPPMNLWGASTIALHPDTPGAIRQVVLTWETNAPARIPNFIAGNIVAVWAPGMNLPQHPLTKPMASRAKLVAYTLLQPTGKPDSAGFQIDFVRNSQTASKAQWRSIGGNSWSIKAQERKTLTATNVLNNPTRIHSVFPEGRHFVSQLSLRAVLPDGQDKRIYYSRRWNPNWPGVGNFSIPVDLPKGTKLTYSAFYDNSENCMPNLGKKPTTLVSGYGDRNDRFWCYLLAEDLPK